MNKLNKFRNIINCIPTEKADKPIFCIFKILTQLLLADEKVRKINSLGNFLFQPREDLKFFNIFDLFYNSNREIG